MQTGKCAHILACNLYHQVGSDAHAFATVIAMALTPPSAPFRGGRTDAWTPRQREVLDLLVRGRTNGQIATELGISLDGAKWHVSEIITKLGVDSREEAAEYWRAQNGLRLRFTRALRALIPTGAWAKIAAGGLTLAVAGIAVAAVVAALQNAGEDDTRAAVSPAATTQATPSPSPDAATPSATQPPPPGSEVIDGVTVQPMSLGANVSFPKNVVLYYRVLGYASDGSWGHLRRAYTDASGQLHRDEVFAPLEALGEVYTVAADLDRQEFIVGVCTKGTCLNPSWADADSENRVYRSLDGGVSWSEYGSLPRNSYLFGSPLDKGAMTVTYAPDAPASYWLFPSGEAVAQPVADARPITVAGQLVWLDTAAGRYVSTDGSRTLWKSPGALVSGEFFESQGGMRFVEWRPDTGKPYEVQPFNHYFGVIDLGGKLQRALSIAGNIDIRANAAISPTVLIGNAGIAVNGELSTGIPDHFQVALIDLATGQIHPIPEVSAGLAGFSAGKNEHAFVSGATTGTFARVNTGGDCLNVREQPATTATSLACFKDGVLLRLGAEPERTDGATTWLSVSTPDGRAGWASAEFLQR